MTRSLTLLLTLSLLAACSDRGVSDRPEDPAAQAPATATEPAAPGATAPGAVPSGDVPLLSSRGVPTAPAAGGANPAGPGPDGVFDAAGLRFALPSGWVAVPPASSMRLAQATIPGGGEFMVFHLGVGGGGGVDANIDRWIGQMEVASGTSPARERFEGNGLIIHLVDVVGTLLPSTMGTGPTEPQPGSRLIGAVIEGPGGPWYFKATGPDGALVAERDALMGMLRGARPSAP